MQTRRYIIDSGSLDNAKQVLIDNAHLSASINATSSCDTQGCIYLDIDQESSVDTPSLVVRLNTATQYFKDIGKYL